jgi:hypothetical protein
LQGDETKSLFHDATSKQGFVFNASA